MTLAKLRAALLVFLIGFALGLSVFAACRLVARSVLTDEARSVAEQLAERLGRAEDVDAGSTPSSVVRYSFLDNDGNEVESFARPGAAQVGRDLVAGNAELARSGRVVVSQPPLLPSLFGLLQPGLTSVAAPVSREGAPVGTLFLELDQSEQLGSLLRLLTVGGLVVLALAVLGVTLAALAATRGGGRASGGASPRANGLPRDPLTGLPTRQGFRATLSETVGRAAKADHQVGLLIVDLDGIREINDVWGHAIGDEVLEAATARLRAFAEGPGALARIAGDDFALIIERDANPYMLRQLAGKIRASLAAPYEVAGKSVGLGVRIGVALFPVNADSADVLFRAADTALSEAKRSGRDGLAFFDTEMAGRMQRRTSLERDLKQALERDELVLFYQPQVELASGKLRGHEALIRWERPGEGILSPRDFLPIAIETGLIKPLGDWVLRKACQDATAWLHTGTVAVNFCAAQIRNQELDKSIAKILSETGLPPERLEIEVPESLFLEPAPGVMETLKRIKALGVRIAMDDFGGGYSGLASLAHFPFDKVKIDRSFVTQVTEDADVAAIVASIVALGRSLSVDITAEGVETDEQVTMLRAAGCSIVQGFLFGAPQRDAPSAAGPVAQAGRAG